LRDLATIVQGFGNVGSVAARILFEGGAKVIGVADVRGGAYNPNGIDIKSLLRFSQETGSVVGFRDTEQLTNDELLTRPCDLLVPAAYQNQITVLNAPRVQAKLIAEGANGPTTPEADAILKSRGISVIPDILCNAGGVTVSYFEWVQDLQEFFWDEGEINARLRKIMVAAFNQVRAIQLERQCTMRTAAYVLGISRVADAIRTRGIYP
ncbi:MAG: Glu/Leu/Phe/Val family dehydrogenase, partial [Chloroflexota bacterium]